MVTYRFWYSKCHVINMQESCYLVFNASCANIQQEEKEWGTSLVRA